MNKRLTFTSTRPVVLQMRKKFSNGGAIEVPTAVGYPIVWGQASSDRGGYSVVLAPNGAKFTDQVLALWHHDFSQPLGGTVNQTLRILPPDDTGVPIEIDLDTNTTAGANAAAYLASGLVGGMSFSMTNGFETYSESTVNGQNIITCSQFTVDEVSITPIPAFAGTSIGLKDDDEDDDTPLPAKMSRISHAQLNLRLSRLHTL